MTDDEKRSEAMREALANVERRRRELGIDGARLPPKPDYEQHLPAWLVAFDKLDETSKNAWDERLRRINAGTATELDRETQESARAALERGEPLPAAATRMPGPELPLEQRTWTPEAMDNPERAVKWGIPPLIAERIARGRRFETRSTKACAKVGRDYLILVLIGAPGCGKTYAAAHWLWSANHEVPWALRKRVGPRRFLEAPSLKEIPFEDRPALGLSKALVVDDCGTEKDFLRDDLATIFVQRYANALPTVLTTNLSEADFTKHYGDRFADRLRELGEFVVVSNSIADSLRGK